MIANDLISIVVPVYNVVDELERCVESMLLQTYANIEVILVDDGSTDGSGALCDELMARDSRIRVLHKKNGGLSSARNAGMSVASGKWLMFVDSDDAIMPDSCEGLLAAAACCEPDIVVGDAVHEFGGATERMLHSSCEPMCPIPSADYIKKTVPSGEFYAPSCFNMYRRSFIEGNGLFFSEGLLHEDMEMQPRVFLAATTVICTGKVFYRYIDRETSIMNASKVTARRNAMQHIYAQWKRSFDSVEDVRLRKCLYGHLSRCYLHTVRELDCGSLCIEGISGKFLFDSGLTVKDKLKAILYMVHPKFLVLMGRIGR